jgi:ADP-ribose pyrophosphatase YjhB (NUDIX family)
MNHIEELRTLIGHRPILMVGAGILIQDADQRLLLLKRSDNHLWGLPGGAVEPGENVEAAARRETLEETGLEVQGLDLFGVFSGPELFYQYPNGDQVYNVSIIYQARGLAGDIRLNQEHTTWQYFADEEIPFHKGSPLNPVFREYISRHKVAIHK